MHRRQQPWVATRPDPFCGARRTPRSPAPMRVQAGLEQVHQHAQPKAAARGAGQRSACASSLRCLVSGTAATRRDPI